MNRRIHNLVQFPSPPPNVTHRCFTNKAVYRSYHFAYIMDILQGGATFCWNSGGAQNTHSHGLVRVGRQPLGERSSKTLLDLLNTVWLCSEKQDSTAVPVNILGRFTKPSASPEIFSYNKLGLFYICLTSQNYGKIKISVFTNIGWATFHHSVLIIMKIMHLSEDSRVKKSHLVATVLEMGEAKCWTNWAWVIYLRVLPHEGQSWFVTCWWLLYMINVESHVHNWCKHYGQKLPTVFVAWGHRGPGLGNFFTLDLLSQLKKTLKPKDDQVELKKHIA